MTTTQTSEIDHASRDHSDIVGGSSAERVLNCPASVKKRDQLPKSALYKSSSYADEGTALHEAITYILENDIIDIDEIVGMKFGPANNQTKMTKALVAEAIVPAMDFFDALDDEMDPEGGMQFLVEKKFEMPGIADAFGTGDIICRSDKRTAIVDWKFGAGVLVRAAYPVEPYIDEDGQEIIPPEGAVKPNSQLMFYGRAALHSFPTMFNGDDPDWPVDLYIVQPRARDADGEIFSKHTTTVGQLEAFRLELVAAVDEALHSPTPRCVPGHWCKFQPCKAVCEHHTGPMLDLGKLDLAAVKKNDPVNGKTVVPTDWGAIYAQYLPFCDAVEKVITEVRAQAHAFLEAGHQINYPDGTPAYKLVPKRATEKYVDEAGAKRHAIGLGFTEEQVMEVPELLSPAQLGALLEPKMDGKTKKARTEAAREQIAEFTEKKSSGTTLALADDTREDITPTPLLMKALAEKLGKL